MSVDEKVIRDIVNRDVGKNPIMSCIIVRRLYEYGNVAVHSALITVYGKQYIQSWINTNYPEIGEIEIESNLTENGWQYVIKRVCKNV